MNGQATMYRFAAAVQFQHPASGQIALVEVTSQDLATYHKDKVTSSYRVGDYATAVYLDADPLSTLNLYGFLGLRPGLGVVDRDPDRPPNDLKTAASVLFILAFVVLCFYGMYGLSRYSPLDWERASIAWTAGIGAVLLGSAIGGTFFYARTMQRRKTAKRNAAALESGEPVEVEEVGNWFGRSLLMTLLIVVGSLLLGAIGTLSLVFTANAQLDTSRAQARPVAITEMVMTTHSFLFCEYKIKYHFLGDNEVLICLHARRNGPLRRAGRNGAGA